jgi:hypothetical protein
MFSRCHVGDLECPCLYHFEQISNITSAAAQQYIAESFQGQTLHSPGPRVMVFWRISSASAKFAFAKYFEHKRTLCLPGTFSFIAVGGASEITIRLVVRTEIELQIHPASHGQKGVAGPTTAFRSVPLFGF